MVQPAGTKFGRFLKTKYIPTLDGELPLLGIYSWEIKTFCKMSCIRMFIADLFIVVKNWSQPRCPSIGKWISGYICTMEQWLTVKRYKQLIVYLCVYTCSKMGKFQKHYAERNEPYTEEHILYDSNDMKFKTRQ